MFHSICVFSDALDEAFGACTYVRWKLNIGVFGVRFVAGKSRVAPSKKLTTPCVGDFTITHDSVKTQDCSLRKLFSLPTV